MSKPHQIPETGKVADAGFQALEVCTPVASIIIPFHNCRKLTEECLRSVAEHSSGVDHEIILIDDASTEQPDIESLPNRDRIRIVRNTERRSFSQNNNYGATLARGEFLVLLNNDTLATAGWLEALVAAARHETNLGVLGNKHLYPQSGLLQHAGMAFDEKDFPWHLSPGTNPDARAVNVRREFQSVTFACVLIPKSVYRGLGGLDEDYRNGFEDVDFCLRARSKGYRVVYTPGSVIFHYGQQTPGRRDTDNANWKLFESRWGGKVDRDLQRLVSEDAATNLRATSRPRLRAEPEPGLHLAVDLSDASAFTWATADLAVALEKRGVAVSVPRARLHDSIEPDKRDRLERMMRADPRGSHHVKWTHYWPKHLKQPLAGDVNAEFFCTNYRYRAEGRALDLWMRHVQVNGYRKLAVSGFNRDALLEVGVPDSDIAVVPLGYSPEIDSHFPLSTPIRPRDRRELHILLVTNSHDLFRYGTDLAIRALSGAFGPDDAVVVHIKDYGHPHGRDLLREWIGEQPRFPRVVWHRKFLSKLDLLKLYADCDAQLAPFRGEGFAMKICDAMALGVPSLFPLFGGPAEFAAPGTFIPLPHDEVPVGACYDRDNFYIGEGAYWCEARVDAMTAELRSLLSRREELARIGTAARQHVRSRYSWDESARKLVNALARWGSLRDVDVSVRRTPDTVPLSVVIPTKDRIEILDRTLTAYAEQTVSHNDYELLLVNDHGERSPLEQLAAKFPSVPVRLLDNPGPRGPAAARNFAIAQARGSIVLITGDDIVPSPGFLREHIDAHRRHPALEQAVLGFTDWHPDLPQTPFMDHITGKGGQQFAYSGLKHDEPTTFDRMYTSNCSLKREFLACEPSLFSTHYRYAAYEDVELAYRLWLRGLELRYTANAVGHHLHEMTPRSFIQRQYKVGRMLTLLAIQHPSFVPCEHTSFLRALELLRSSNAARHAVAQTDTEPPHLLEQLVRNCEAMLSLGRSLQQTDSRPVVNDDLAAWQKWLADGIAPTWEATNELVLRLGMAEEWAQRTDDIACAQKWVQLVALPRIAGRSAMWWGLPFSTPDLVPFTVGGSYLPYRGLKLLREHPRTAPLFLAIEGSKPGQALRRLAIRMLRGS